MKPDAEAALTRWRDAGPLSTESMKLLVDRYAADIQSGFEMAGYGELYSPFMEEVKQAAFVEKDLAVGETK